MLWPALTAALLPLSLTDIVDVLPSLVLRLELMDSPGNFRAEKDRSGPHQVENFRRTYGDYVDPSS